jgi:hypothetical protein
VTRYEHTQVGHAMIWVLLSGAAIAAAIGAIFPAAWVSLVIAVVLLLTIAGFYKLTIKIDNETLCASFGSGLIKKEVPVDDVVACEPIRIWWWYGWGIHFTPYGWLYNIAGRDAVVITMRNGRRFSLGTEDPHGLAAAIRAHRSVK